jgi:hypothetical protein
MGPRLLATAITIAIAGAHLSSQASTPSVGELMARVGAYAASYGEKASMMVAVEKYIQHFGTGRPRQIVAEFAIVKTPGGWVGFRDVVEVNGEKVSDRRDRLMKIFTDPSADSRMAKAISEESARYNIGPISRNFNVPTTVMLVFLPSNLPRFVFTLKGEDRIAEVVTREIAFKEVRTPTLTMTRAGKDVPMEGSLWVTPAEGAVVRTRMRLRNFADAETTSQPHQPEERRAGSTTAPGTGRPMPAFNFGLRTIDSDVSFTVDYRWHPEFAMWLPASMNEVFSGPIRMTSGPPVSGRATASAKYSDFKSFQTTATIK